MIRRLVVLLALTAAVPSLASAQMAYSKAVLKTFDLDSVNAYLRAESLDHSLVFKRADKHVTVYERIEGTTLAGGRQVPLIRIVTFHFEKAKTGTRVIATEELVARQPGGAELPIPVDLTSKASDLQDLLLAARSKSMPPGTTGADSAAAAQ